MNEIAVVDKGADWHRLKALVLDSVSSPITKRVYNLGLNEFFEWYGQEPRPGFTKATVAAWRVALEARGLSAVSINVRISSEVTRCWPPPITLGWMLCFRRITELTRWRGGKAIEEFQRSGTLPPDARLTESGTIARVFQESATFWRDLVALGFDAETPAAPARPTEAIPGAEIPDASQSSDSVVPEWARNLDKPDGRKAAREGWKQHWSTAEHECTNDDLTDTAFKQQDRPFPA